MYIYRVEYFVCARKHDWWDSSFYYRLGPLIFLMLFLSEIKMLPKEVIEKADFLDLTLLKTEILMDRKIPNNYKSQVDDLLFEYRHFLAIS